MSRLIVLSIAYPFAPVGPDAVGGAEQILHRLDRALVEAGHRSLVLACPGSVVAGELLPGPPIPALIDDAAKEAAWARYRDCIAETLARERVDLVHLHGVDCHGYLPPPGPPALITLHLPPEWYAPELLRPARPGTYLHCVSAAQARRCPPGTRLLPTIANGVAIAPAPPPHARRGFALMLGRICPEKGFHHGLDAARAAGVPALIGGQVHNYAWHRQYFAAEIEPRLDRRRRFLGPLGLARKRRLLAAAQCLLVPSLAPETSSLVAMEALACGTPVIAFPAGALPEIVEHGVTGFIVPDAEAMASAIPATRVLSRAACRAAAQRRFDSRRMTEAYLALYCRLAATSGAGERVA
jgi:glycosyltransferase involved in cell wall biosynthesis